MSQKETVGREIATSPAAIARGTKEIRAWLRDRFSDQSTRQAILDDLTTDRSARGFYFKEAHAGRVDADQVSPEIAIAAEQLSPAVARVLAALVARASGGVAPGGVIDTTASDDADAASSDATTASTRR